MSKFILFALLAVASPSLASQTVFACGGRSCHASCAPTCAAPACVAPASVAPAAPSDPHAGMDMTQANSAGTYRSFSYEPGATQPTLSAPARTMAPAYRTYRQPSNSFYDSVRGDRKVRGLH